MPIAASTIAQVSVSGAGQSWSVPLAPGGLLVGRSEPCGLVLDDRLVSRRHARVYRDPFDRWIIEDLGSFNGVWVGGRRIKAHAVAPGERAVIGPFTLTFSVPQDRRMPVVETIVTTALLSEELAGSTQVQVQPSGREAVSGHRLKELDDIGERLAGVTCSGDLYTEACRCLVPRFGTTALVLRLAAMGAGASEPPQALACEPAGALESEAAAQPADVRLSRRVIQAVRESGQAVMASNVRLAPGQLGLTIRAGDRRPRAVYCVPITGDNDWTDVLYLDAAADQADAEVFDFVRAVARQVGLAGRGILSQEQAVRIRLIDQQLAMAREIQQRLVPTQLDLSPAVDFALVYEPAFWVGGDYCDVWPLADGRIAFAVGDVTGKGLPAALVMTNVHAALRTAVRFQLQLAEVAAGVSDHLMRYLSGRMYASLVLGLLDPGTGDLEYLNAGHVLPLVVRPSGPPSELGRPMNPPLGLIDAKYVAETMTLEPGTGLIVMTDGVTESRSPQGEMLDPGGVLRALDGAGSASSEDLVHVVTEAASAFREHLPAHDDLTVLALRRRTTST